MEPTVFARTLQESNLWLKELVEEGRFVHERAAYAALRATLMELRDRLTVEEGAHLAAQLPTLIRGVFYEAWVPAKTPTRVRDRETFVQNVRDRMTGHDEIPNVDGAVRAVFSVLKRHVSEGEIRDVVQMLPDDLKPLWSGQEARADRS